MKFHLICLTVAQNWFTLTVISALGVFYKITLIGTCQWPFLLYTVQVHSQIHHSAVSRICAPLYLQHTGRNHLVTQTNLQRTVTDYFRTASYVNENHGKVQCEICNEWYRKCCTHNWEKWAAQQKLISKCKHALFPVLILILEQKQSLRNFIPNLKTSMNDQLLFHLQLPSRCVGWWDVLERSSISDSNSPKLTTIILSLFM